MSLSKPLISVIIPTFNRKEMVIKAIESVMQQTYCQVELIIVDDGSNDRTASTLKGQFSQAIIIEQNNSGVSAARNSGIQVAKGSLIALLDSDDLWMPHKLERQVAFFHKHPSAMICQTEEIWIRNGRRVNPKKRHQKPTGMIFESSLELCLVSPSAVMIRKPLLAEVGLFDESLPACEDYDLWLRIAWKYPIHLIKEPLIIKHGGHADQLSKTPELDKYRIAAICKILASGYLNSKQKQAALEMLKKKCTIYAQGCMKRNKVDTAQYYSGLARTWQNRITLS